MKLKTPAVLFAATALTKVATAQDEAYGSSLYNSSGSLAQPGIVLSKAQRQQLRVERIDSAISMLDGQVDDRVDYETQHDWSAFKAKLAANIESSNWLRGLDLHIEHNFRPGSKAATQPNGERTRRSYGVRSLIIAIIALLLVFGALYTLVEYLLFVTRVSACSVSTVYFPITYTVTSGLLLTSQSAVERNATAPNTTYTSFTTQTSTVVQTQTITSFLNLQTEATSASISSTGSPAYVYSINPAGSTEWANGVSPSSEMSMVVVTTTIVMLPIPPTDTAAALQSTVTTIETVTPPAYTSTVFSFDGPDLTSTSTSTHYVTLTVSEVSPSASITATRTSFGGVSNSGWNASSAADSSTATPGMGSQRVSSTTITGVSYFGTGPETTSTTTFFITTTIAQAYTTTISQVIQSPVGTGHVTTVTALPVTVTPRNSGLLLSTKVTAPHAVSSTAIASSPTSRMITTMTTRDLGSAPALSAVSLTPTLSTAPAWLSQSVGNTTASYNTQSASRGRLGSVSPPLSVASINSTSSGSLELSTDSRSSTSEKSSSFGTSSLPIRVTSTVSTVISYAPSLSNGSSERSFVSSSSQAPAGSSIPVGGLSNSHASIGPINSTPSVVSSSSTTSHHITNLATSSSTGYRPLPVSPASSASLSAANSFTSASTLSTIASSRRSSVPSSGSLSRSAKATSSLSSFGQVTTSPVANSSKSLLSSPSLATRKSTSTFQDNSTLSSTLISETLITSLTLSAVRSTQPFTIQTSLLSSAGTTTSSNASIPFPASSATATPTAGCGEYGPFVVDFDDQPRFLSTKQNKTDITQAPPVQNPYHHLTFSDGYVYAPEPSEPYQPFSPPHLAVFLANATGRTAGPFGEPMRPGEIGDGPRESISAFWFDAISAFFGCDNPGPGVCTLVLSAYTWSPVDNDEVLTYTQNETIPACSSLTSLDCQLHKVDFPTSFRGLTGVQVQAYTGNDQRMFFIDDLSLNWSNSSCAAGLLRQSSS